MSDSFAVYGVLAELPTSQSLATAIENLHEEGYTKFDAYAPYQSEELIESLGPESKGVPAVFLTFAVLGGLAGYGLQYWVNLDAYPLNVGGKPLHSWPAFIPVTFECTILSASIAGLLGMLVLNGLPRPHHPLFAIPRFAERASLDCFFLCIEAGDPKFELTRVRELLTSLGATEVWDVGK